MNTTPHIADFGLGEITPKFYGRWDSPNYFRGASLFQNFKPNSQGGFTKRPGFLSVQATLSNNKALVRAFIVSQSECYLLEVTNTKIRIFRYASNWVYQAAVQTITTPYVTADIPSLQFSYSFPYLYIAHQSYSPALLKYTAANTFSYTQVIPFSGSSPFFLTGTTHTNTTVDGLVGAGFSSSLSAYTTGTVTSGSNTITAVASTVGLQIGWSITGPGIPYGASIQSFGVSTIVLSVVATASSGAGAAIAINQSIWVGMPVTGSGIPVNTTVATVVSATSITISNAATASATVSIAISQQSTALPFQSAGNYPRCVCAAFDRVWWASTANAPLDLWASTVGTWDQNGNMGMGLFETVSYVIQTMNLAADGTPTTVTPTYTPVNTLKSVVGDADAINVTIASEYDDAIMSIQASMDLIVCTSNGEWVVPSTSTANNIFASLISRTGSAGIQGGMVAGGMIFTRALNRGVSLLNWQGQSNPYTPPVDLSFYAEHFFTNGTTVVDFDFAQQPEICLYFVLSNGQVAACILNQQFNVIAWWRLVVNGTIVSCCTLPVGTRDALITCVQRGGTYYLEELDEPDWYDSTATNGNEAKANYLDASFRLDSAGSSITLGTSAFNGQAFTCVVDGAVVGTAVVTAGVVTLPVAASTAARAGLAYTSTFSTLNIMPQLQSGSGVVGSSMTKAKSSELVGTYFLNTLDAQLGPDTSNLFSAALGASSGTIDVTKANPPMFTGIDLVQVSGNWSEALAVVVQSARPLPCSVLAFVPEVKT